MISPLQPSLIVTSTARLARSLQLAHTEEHIEKHQQQWRPLNVSTLETWLDETLSVALLCGEIDLNSAPQKRLSVLEERLLWQQVIASRLKQHVLGDLFDLAGLADACIEANRYMVAWRLRISKEAAELAEETRQFLDWQQVFQALCKKLNALEQVRYFDWQIECLAKDAVDLPASLVFAGFDQSAPQEKRLREVLKQRTCEMTDLATGQVFEAETQHAMLTDQSCEMRSMVAWASAELAMNPQVTLAMVVPNLAELRNRLADLLDDVFQPMSVRPSMAEAHRVYNISLGLPLTQQPVIQAALLLIRLWSSREFTQADISAALLSPYWSASAQEADDRALLDATMREYLSQNTTWPRLMRFIGQQHARLSIAHLLEDMQDALAYMQAQSRTQAPSAWANIFRTLLQRLKWSGQRVESSHEYQAKQAWEKALQQLERLDFLGEVLSNSAASQLLQHICKEQVFQPETTHKPPIQILGMMEALSAPVDAMWVMGMNDDSWPPPARPNALLPAHIQRAARVANADSAVQAEFASIIHQRLLHSAKRIIFSSSLKQGEKVLRVSPLMQSVSKYTLPLLVANTLAETLAAANPIAPIQLSDHIAPPVLQGEHVRGGTGLIRAQAICPAWAFYQFRLGAKKLKIPKNGLDAAERGQLVHGALEQFWHPDEKYRHFSDLQAMAAEALQAAIHTAAHTAITTFVNQHEETFSAPMLALEHERLCALLAGWLSFEKERQLFFKMQACESEKKVNINGIEVTLKIDRVHQLNNGGLELVDYKTGQLPSMKSWGEGRLTEPQLPIYAVFYAEGEAHIAGIQFGMVKIAEHHFSGISESNFEDDERRKPEFIRQFADWESLKTYWKNRIEALVDEIKIGQAAIIFVNETDLTYCEVTPLLRLPERQLQFERHLGAQDAYKVDTLHE